MKIEITISQSLTLSDTPPQMPMPSHLKPMPLGCTALCRPMRGLISLSKLSTAQHILTEHP